MGSVLEQDELLLVRSSKGWLLKPGLTGEALQAAYRQFYSRVDVTAQKANGVPESEIDAAIDKAVDAVRQGRL